jgi:hypothetical protein
MSAGMGAQVKAGRAREILLREQSMIAIRLSKSQWGKAWRAMIEIGPVRLVSPEPIYEVLPAHLQLLNSRGFSYEVVNERQAPKEKRRHASSD